MNLILVRHGETDWNRTGRCQGRSDIELNDNGRRQARELGLSLRDADISAVYSSDLKRAISTAEEVARHHGLAVEIDPDLREMDQGEFEGLLFTEIRERYPDILNRWRDNPDSLRIPEGESLGEVQLRASNALDRLMALHDGKTIVAVSHNLTITTLLCKITGVGLSGFRNFNLQAACKNTILSLDGRIEVAVLNDISHLSPAAGLPDF